MLTIDAIFTDEHDISGLSIGDRQAVRQGESRPLVAELEDGCVPHAPGCHATPRLMPDRDRLDPIKLICPPTASALIQACSCQGRKMIGRFVGSVRKENDKWKTVVFYH
jgi:hypothetical protein